MIRKVRQTAAFLAFAMLMLSLQVTALPDDSPPPVVQEAKALFIPGGKVSVTWEMMPNVDSYIIERSKQPRQGYVTVAENVTEAEYIDTNDGAYPYYRITAVNGAGKSLPLQVICSPELTEILTSPTDGTVYDICATGNYVFTAEYEAGLCIYKISGNSIVLVKVIKEKSFKARSLCLTDGYLYVGCVPDFGKGAVLAYDISDPEKPAKKGAALANVPTKLINSGNRLYAASGSSGVTVIDICIRDNPKQLNTVADIGTVTAVCADDDKLYIGNTAGSLYIYNITNPYRPILLSKSDYAFSNEQINPDNSIRIYSFSPEIYDIKLKQNYVLLANKFFVKAVNVENPRRPVAQFDFRESLRERNSLDSALEGNMYFVADNGWNILRVYNVSDLNKPPLWVYSVPFKDAINAVHIYQNKIYIANNGMGLTVLQFKEGQ